MEEKENEIMTVKKALKLKGQEISEINMKVELLEKKLESADMEVYIRLISIEWLLIHVEVQSGY